LVRDEHSEARDRTIAKHVMNLHAGLAGDGEATGELDIEKMKRFIAYAKR
jgi:DNA replication licensing factor MCM5